MPDGKRSSADGPRKAQEAAAQAEPVSKIYGRGQKEFRVSGTNAVWGGVCEVCNH